MPAHRPAPLEPDYADNSRGRVRRFIVEGQHPESSVERFGSLKPALRSGDPFPFVIAVIPSYNEQDSILRTIESLRTLATVSVGAQGTWTRTDVR